MSNLLKMYQEFTPETAIYPKEYSLSYLFPALASEAGELCGKYQKFLRDHQNISRLKWEVKDEVGDLLWNVSELLNYFGLTFEEVLVYNRDKLLDRKVRSKIEGSGDNR